MKPSDRHYATVQFNSKGAYQRLKMLSHIRHLTIGKTLKEMVDKDWEKRMGLPFGKLQNMGD